MIYRCKRCGYTFYVFSKVGLDFFGMPTPSEISNWYAGVCPKCGKPVEKPSARDVKIIPFPRRDRELLLRIKEGKVKWVSQLHDGDSLALARLRMGGLVDVYKGRIKLTYVGATIASLLARKVVRRVKACRGRA